MNNLLYSLIFDSVKQDKDLLAVITKEEEVIRLLPYHIVNKFFKQKLKKGLQDNPNKYVSYISQFTNTEYLETNQKIYEELVSELNILHYLNPNDFFADGFEKALSFDDVIRGEYEDTIDIIAIVVYIEFKKSIRTHLGD